MDRQSSRGDSVRRCGKRTVSGLGPRREKSAVQIWTRKGPAPRPQTPEVRLTSSRAYTELGPFGTDVCVESHPQTPLRPSDPYRPSRSRTHAPDPIPSFPGQGGRHSGGPDTRRPTTTFTDDGDGQVDVDGCAGTAETGDDGPMVSSDVVRSPSRSGAEWSRRPRTSSPRRPGPRALRAAVAGRATTRPTRDGHVPTELHVSTTGTWHEGTPVSAGRTLVWGPSTPGASVVTGVGGGGGVHVQCWIVTRVFCRSVQCVL